MNYNLQSQINHILQTEESLYNFLHTHFLTNGVIDKTLLTESVLERLFIDENKIDSLTGKLFGLDKKQVSRIRAKHGITINSERHLLKVLQRGIDKDFERAKELMGENEVVGIRDALKQMTAN